MNTSPFAFYDHRPRYHHGISKREHIEQVTGSWWIAVYGSLYSRKRIPCYGLPRVWGWSTKDCPDGPRSRNWKIRLRRVMRKRARREGIAWMKESMA